MTATRHLAASVAGVAVGASANAYCPPVTGALVLPTTEASATITFRTAGTISNLFANVLSGNRSSSSPGIWVRKNGTDTALTIALAPGGTPVSVPGQYEDTNAAHDVSVAAGDTITIHVFGGGSGNANWTFTNLGFLFTATDGSAVTHLGATGSLGYGNASETSYRQPGGGPAKTTTQAQGEWLVKLPANVTGVTIRKLYVRVSTNNRTTDQTISINGATGAGTPPTITIPAADNAAATYEDQTNEVIAVDGDKVSFKSVTAAADSLTNTIEEIVVEIVSALGVSFLVAASPAGASLSSNNFAIPLGGILAGNTTEARSQAKAGIAVRVSLLSAYIGTANTGTLTLRAGAANVGTPGNVAVSTAGANAWVTDATNRYVTATTDLIDVNFARTATPVVYCQAVTLSGQIINVGQASETDTAAAISPAKRAAVGQSSETDTAQAITVVQSGGGGHTVSVGQASETDSSGAVTPAKRATVGQSSETDSAQAITAQRLELLGQSSETDSAQAISPAKRAAVGQASETETAQPIIAARVEPVGQATEADSAQPITPAHALTLGQATEVDEAETISPAHVLTLGQSSETDTAGTTSAAHGVSVGQASELDTAGTITQPGRVGQASELDTAGTIMPAHVLTLGQASELDSAGTLTPRKVLQLGQSSEVDSAQAFAPRKAAQLGQAAELDTAGTISPSHRGHVGQALEVDTALPITGTVSQLVTVGQALEVDSAFSIRTPLRVTIGQALEVDSAGRTFRRVEHLPIGALLETDTRVMMDRTQAPLFPELETEGLTIA